MRKPHPHMPDDFISGYPCGFPVRIYWEDTDAGGVVFYANYLKFFERARTEWLRSRGLEQQQLQQTTGGMFVATDAHIRWLRPARLDDILIVTARPIHKGRASLTVAQHAMMWQADEPNIPENSPTILCEGTIRLGWVNATTLRPVRIPNFVLAALTP